MQTIQHGSRAEIASEASPADPADFSKAPEAARLSSAGADLQPSRPMRWVPSRKAQIVDAVRGGMISLDEALERYALSIDEFLMWQRGLELFGLAGLRVNRSKHVRNLASRQADQ